MRKTKTSLRAVTVNGQKHWCVTWPKPVRGRERRHFKSTARKMADDAGYKAAKSLHDQKVIEQRNFGTAGAALTERQRAEYLQCSEKLKPFGKTLADALAFYLPHLQATARSCTVADLNAELLRAKTADGARERYQGDLRSRFGRFKRDHGTRIVAEIQQREVDDWLRDLYELDTSKPLSPVTRNNYRRALIVGFNFAIDRGYCLTNPALKTAEAKQTKTAVGILTVQETADLLASCDARILPTLALGLFAGLRPEAEIARLDWSNIDFADHTINIEPDKTKAESSARYVEMPENLVAWLLPHRKTRGPVFPGLTVFYDLLREARKRAGIEHWPHDACRHSFASYHYGAHRSAPLTMAQMGHTNARTFFRHYRRPMKQAAALPYWKIVPADERKIIDLTADELLVDDDSALPVTSGNGVSLPVT